MLKRLFGIDKIEAMVERFRSDMHNHWGHTQNLYKMHELNSMEIEKLRQELNVKTSQLVYIMNGLIDKIEKVEDRDVREIVPEEGTKVLAQERFPESDFVILHIMHQGAAFDPSNAVNTAQIYDNLPFQITKRGLRKKLITLVKQGFVMTSKKSNERYWYISTGRLAAVKQMIAAKNKGEQKED